MRAVLHIPGEPKGKGRPRFSIKGGHVRAYTPAETAEYERKIRASYLDQNPGKRLSGAVRADITAVFTIPASANKKRRAKMDHGEIPCTKKPDLDNIAKTVLDSLNGIAYDDDKQIIFLCVNKRYGLKPGVTAVLSEIEIGG